MGAAVPVGSSRETINGQAAMALALLSACEENRRHQRGGPTLEDVSRRLSKLLDDKIHIRDLGLRRIPGGVYSEEVETFVGHLLAEGLATHRSPVRLTDEGEELLRTIIRVESRVHAAALRRAGGLLGVNTSDLLVIGG
jgi:hypothetical protein